MRDRKISKAVELLNDRLSDEIVDVDESDGAHTTPLAWRLSRIIEELEDVLAPSRERAECVEELEWSF